MVETDCHHRALNHLRNRKVQLIDIEEAGEVPDEEAYDEEGIELNIQRVQNAIQQLPDGFRTVLCCIY